MNTWLRAVSRFLRAEDGPTAVEYAVMLLLVLLTVIAAVGVFGQATADSFDKSGKAISTATQ